MALIAVVSPKGGVGKTTSAITLAAALSVGEPIDGGSTLLWDLDPNADATVRLGLELPTDGLGRLLAGRRDPSDAVNSWGLEQAAQTVAGLRVVPAGGDIGDVEARYAGIVDGGGLVAHRLRELARDSVVVADTAPGLKSLLGRAVLAVADVVIVPVIPEPRAERYVYDVRAVLHGLANRAELVTIATMVGADSGGLAELHAALDGERLPIAAVIPREAVVNDSIWEARPILQSAPGSKASAAYSAFAQRLVQGTLLPLLRHDKPIGIYTRPA